MAPVSRQKFFTRKRASKRHRIPPVLPAQLNPMIQDVIKIPSNGSTRMSIGDAMDGMVFKAFAEGFIDLKIQLDELGMKLEMFLRQLEELDLHQKRKEQADRDLVVAKMMSLAKQSGMARLKVIPGQRRTTLPALARRLQKDNMSIKEGLKKMDIAGSTRHGRDTVPQRVLISWKYFFGLFIVFWIVLSFVQVKIVVIPRPLADSP